MPTRALRSSARKKPDPTRVACCLKVTGLKIKDKKSGKMLPFKRQQFTIKKNRAYLARPSSKRPRPKTRIEPRFLVEQKLDSTRLGLGKNLAPFYLSRVEPASRVLGHEPTLLGPLTSLQSTKNSSF